MAIYRNPTGGTSTPLWVERLSNLNLSANTTVSIPHIARGDRLYFVVSAAPDATGAARGTAGDDTSWDPEITYSAVEPCNCTGNVDCSDCMAIVPGLPLKVAEEFRVRDSLADPWVARYDGDVTITGTLDLSTLPAGITVTPSIVHTGLPAVPMHEPTTINCSNIDATLDMLLATSVLPTAAPTYTTGVGGTAYGTGTYTISVPLHASLGDQLTFTVAQGGTHPSIDPDQVRWTPTVEYSTVSLPSSPTPGALPNRYNVSVSTATLTCVSPPCELANTLPVPLETIHATPEVNVEPTVQGPTSPPMNGYYGGWAFGEWNSDSPALDESTFQPASDRAAVTTAVAPLRAFLTAACASRGNPLLTPLPVPAALSVGSMTPMHPYRGPGPSGSSTTSPYPTNSWIGSGADGYIQQPVVRGPLLLKPSIVGGGSVDSTTHEFTFDTISGYQAFHGATLRAGESEDVGVNVSTWAGSPGFTSGYGRSQAEFFDFDGDRRPDSIERVNGHIYVAIQQHDDDANNVHNPSGFAPMPVEIDSTEAFGQIREIEHHVEQVGFSPTAVANQVAVTAGGKDRSTSTTSVSLSAVQNESDTTIDWHDVNGDGLPDQVRLQTQPDGTSALAVRLNLGHSLGHVTVIPYEPWDRSSNSYLERQRSLSGNVQGAFQRIGGGALYGVHRVLEQMIDLNGDGLPDRVRVRDSDHLMQVMFNAGDGSFGLARTWQHSDWPIDPAATIDEVLDPLLLDSDTDAALTSQTGFGGNVSAGPAVRAGVGFVCLMASAGVRADLDVQNERLGFADMDGDGHVDQVLRRPMSGEMYVRLNQTGRSNLLSVVHNPLGGSFTLSYGRQGNVVASTDVTSLPAIDQIAGNRTSADAPAVPAVPALTMPHNQWALTGVTVSDGRTDTVVGTVDLGLGHTLTSTFDYFDSGNYDRIERTDYGYGHVRTTRADGSHVDSLYYNQSYARHGLLGRVDEYGPDNSLLRSTLHEYPTPLTDLPVGPTLCAPRCTTAPTPPCDNACPPTCPPTPPPTCVRECSTTTLAVFPAEIATTTTTFYGANPLRGPPSMVTRVTRDFQVSTDGLDWKLSVIHDHGDFDELSDDVDYNVAYFTGTTPGTRCIRPSTVWATPPMGVTTTAHMPIRTANYDPATCFAYQVSNYVDGGARPGGASNYSATSDGSGNASGDNLTTVLKPDQYGNVMSAWDPSGYHIAYTYDSSLHQYLISEIDSFPYTSSATWDLVLGRMLTSTDENNNTETFHYDEFGRTTAIFAPGDTSTPFALTDTSTPTLSFSYDPLTTTPGAHVSATTHHRPDPTGEFGDPTVLDTVTWMDGIGRVVEIQRTGFVNGAAGMIVSGRTIYDALGRTASQGQPSFLSGGTGTYAPPPVVNLTQQSFDFLSRPLVTTYPDTTTTSNAYAIVPPSPAATSGTTAWLDVTATDQLGRTRDTFQDAAGRTLRVRERNQLGTDSTRSAPTHTLDTDYTYDALGRLTTVMDAADAPRNRTIVTYDSLGRRTTINSPDLGTVESRFDASGNLAERVSPNQRAQVPSVATRYTYQTGRLSRVDYPDLVLPTGHVPQSPTVYTYGAAGASHNGAARVVTRDDASGQTLLQYDMLGETSSRMFNPVDPHTGRLMASTYTTGTRYDRLGRLETVTYPDGELLTYSYDAGGAVTTAWSARNRYVNNITYNEFGQRTRVYYGNGVVSNYVYTSTLHRLDTLNTVGPAATNVQNVRYTYANNGNITDLSDGPEDTLVVGGYPGVVKQHYEYDALDQIRLATGSYGTRTTSSSYTQLFTYDAIGRMSTNALTTMSSGPTTTLNQNYAYPTAGSIRHPLHAPGQISDPTTPPNSRSFVWDANGNQTAFTGASAGTRVTVWDNENRILSIDDDGKTTTSFLYDADGERTHKVSSGRLTLYPDQWTSIRELSSGSAMETNHIYAGSVRVASSVTASTDGSGMQQAYWYHGDHLSSTNYVTDSMGTVTEHLEFFPFGGTWIQEDVWTHSLTPWEDFRFTGKELDGETGLTYFGARYFDSTTALWASGDPILASYLGGSPNGGVFRPSNLGLYSYAFNSPIVLRDPNGMWTDGDPRETRGTGAAVAEFLWHHLEAAGHAYVNWQHRVERRLAGQLADSANHVPGATAQQANINAQGGTQATGPIVGATPAAAGNALIVLAGSIGRVAPGAAPPPPSALSLGAIEEMAASANQAVGRGGNSAVGTAIQSHAGRAGSYFSQFGSIRTAAGRAAAGRAFINDLLNDPQAVVTRDVHPTAGPMTSVRLPNGAGAQWSANGFYSLLEPYTPRPPPPPAR